MARCLHSDGEAMANTTSHARSQSGLWALLNRPQTPEPETMRAGCIALFVAYAAIAGWHAPAAGSVANLLRVGVLLYAALGIYLAPGSTWRIQRVYAFGLALVLPLEAVYVDTAQGNHLGDVALSALAIFVTLIFVQTLRDLLVVYACLFAGVAVILYSAPPPALPLSTLAVTLAVVATTALLVAVRVQLHRARWSDLVADLEAALSERSEWQGRYEAATAASGQVLYDWEPASDHICYGGAVERILGYTPAELGGGLAQWMALIHSEDVDYVAAAARRTVAERRSGRLRYRMRRKDGGLIIVEDSGHAVVDERGSLVRMVGFVADVTERTAAERVRDEEAAISTALARVGGELISSLETPVLMDRLCRITSEVLDSDFSQTWIAADGGYRMIASYGLSLEEWEQLRLMRLPVSSGVPLFDRIAREDVVAVTSAMTENQILAPLMAYFGFGSALMVALRRGADVIGVHAVGRRRSDTAFSLHQHRIVSGIGQLASMALSNAQLVEELERASNLKSEFVSTMSHELRTPLNVILGYTDMLGDEALSPPQGEIVARIRRSSVELLEMIEATLDLSRISAGKDVPTFELVTVAELWKELADEFAVLPRPPALALRFEPVGAVTLRTDRRKLKMILKNLVGNALKFTPAGEVAVRCAGRGSDVAFSVCDTGIGIPDEHLPRIFDMFRQVDSSDARSYSGAGLGLYIVRQLAAQLGGSVGVDSQLGRGSTFELVLPAFPAAAAREIAA
ncbi:MAG: hypothetical protein B6D46_01075 [Polyangiaceae bacterium UTPRO1]|nr:MAG: hypothetical protein B6D46_01075 [Polyangiaceae bacterium UTPRO1]